MTNALACALALASRGARVFPLIPGGRTPTAKGWQDRATSDAAVVLSWFAERPDINYGVCGGDGLLILDVDAKNGKDGWSSYISLGLEACPTYTVRTPRNGAHLYFAAGPYTNKPLVPGIDVRSVGGYVVGPGSVVSEGAYVVSADIEFARAPEHIIARLTSLRDAEVTAAASELDTPAAIAWAEARLAAFEPAVEGCNGNDTTYRAACDARDCGLSEDVCAAVMARVYNPRCVPPWDRDELAAVVANAYAYAQRAPGSRSPTDTFSASAPAAAKLAEIAEASAQAARPRGLSAEVFRPLADIDADVCPDFVFENFCEVGELTQVIATGGTGKSALTLTLAAHAACGRGYAGFEYGRDTPVRCAVFNSEDTHWRQKQRLIAAASHHALPMAALDENLLIGHSTRPEDKVLAFADRDKPVINKDGVLRFVDMLRSERVELVVLDTFSALHQLNENDNAHMAYFVDLLREIAVQAGAALVFNHHTPKGAGMTPGDIDTGRGASAIGNGVRYGFTLCGASDEDAQQYNITPDGRHVRLDAAKTNHVIRTGEATWLYRYSVRLPYLDRKGRPVSSVALGAPAQPIRAVANLDRVQIAAAFFAALMRDRNTAELRVNEAVNLLRSAHSVFSTLTETDARAFLRQFLTAGYRHEGHVVRYVSDKNGPRIVLQ